MLRLASCRHRLNRFSVNMDLIMNTIIHAEQSRPVTQAGGMVRNGESGRPTVEHAVRLTAGLDHFTVNMDLIMDSKYLTPIP